MKPTPQHVHNRWLKSHLALLRIRHVYGAKPIPNMLHVLCGTMYQERAIRDIKYYEMENISPKIKDTTLKLDIWI